ncbi:MAG: hypothetical protein JWO55_721 [Candidatus Saccharibacteria bacterium]|jgi:hypothetical protein|nr:hypothetical protein [Candidatus Saccharibacteria bacterium]
MTEFSTYIGCLTLAYLGEFRINLILGAPIGNKQFVDISA